jgi:hypothetical protein
MAKATLIGFGSTTLEPIQPEDRPNHEQNKVDDCRRCTLRRPYSDRRVRNANRNAPVRHSCEHRASALGLRPLRPLLVATELLLWWLLRLRLPPSPPPLAPPLLASSSLLVMFRAEQINEGLTSRAPCGCVHPAYRAEPIPHQARRPGLGNPNVFGA